MGEPSESELIALMTRAKAGSKQAFEQVYKQFFLPVYRYTLRRVKDQKEAEDITQTVFLKVYISTTKFSDKAVSPLAYFFTAARSVIADYWRKNKRDFVSAEEAPEAISMEKISHQVEQQLAVEQALGQLDDEPGRVLMLKFFEGHSTEEIARSLQKTPEAIRQIQCRALRKLREYLNNTAIGMSRLASPPPQRGR